MRKKHKILVVDDEQKVLNSLTRLFKRNNKLTLITTDSPMKALKIIEKTNVDLIITDQRMPQMTGVELLERILKKYPHIITIILTGYSDIDIVLKAINEIGVYKFILKPWENEDLYWTIVRALEMLEVIDENKKMHYELKKREAYMRKLENEYPGISRVKKGVNGSVIIDDMPGV